VPHWDYEPSLCCAQCACELAKTVTLFKGRTTPRFVERISIATTKALTTRRNLHPELTIQPATVLPNVPGTPTKKSVHPLAWCCVGFATHSLLSGVPSWIVLSPDHQA
jgi:hypothetical protein